MNQGLRYLFSVWALLFFSCSSVTPPEPVLPVPSGRQLVWNEMEFYAFVHFSINTFTDKEWGYGDESPALFNPEMLDCMQWARVFSEAGMKGIILTAKHHDGFCLWPSAFTEHSVKNSPWRNGTGDVVGELSEACAAYGLKMGIYLSPWDRNHPDYGKPEYLVYYRNQLRELLTGYGDIFEVWFDGANGGTGWYGGADEERRIDRETYYDWENTWALVRELQPGACIFSDAGPDIRWVGNERGYAAETNWSNLNRDKFYPGSPNYAELPAGHDNGTHWVPAEADVSIRPGWFYHSAEDDQVKSLESLIDIYYNSVGRNASLLLNFPVDTRGLLHESDVKRVMELADVIESDFAVNLAVNKKLTASDTRGRSKRYGASRLVDGNVDTYWATNDFVDSASVEIDFGEPATMNRFMVQEMISLGQRVQEFNLKAWVDNEWVEIATGTTIGRKRILRFDEVNTSRLSFTIKAAKASPAIAEIGVYHSVN